MTNYTEPNAEQPCMHCKYISYDSFHKESWCNHKPAPKGLPPRLLVGEWGNCTYFEPREKYRTDPEPMDTKVAFTQLLTYSEQLQPYIEITNAILNQLSHEELKTFNIEIQNRKAMDIEQEAAFTIIKHLLHKKLGPEY